jgi:CIC family chloride channel protein
VDSNAHKGDFFVDVLAAIRVEELMPQLRKVRMIPEDATFTQFLEIFRSSKEQYFPVVNKDEKLTGIFSVNDVRGILFDHEIGDLVRMKDVAISEIIYTTPSEDLNEVLKKFTIRNLQRLPVVKDEDHNSLLGMLDRREVIQYYNRRVQEIKGAVQSPELDRVGEMSSLRDVTVGQAMNRYVASIYEETKAAELIKLFRKKRINTFPVLDHLDRLSGILSLTDFQQALIKKRRFRSVRDIATRKVVTVTEDESLLQALEKITSGDFAILPVVDRKDDKKIVGVISRRDIVSAYGEVLMKEPTGDQR